ncbi:MAG: hypothetical protein LUQ65_13625, partial [Candidatus Helarchaeota archaeon]|nr:hypothetical protein [Candidatus Helarchaeota archaeon]
IGGLGIFIILSYAAGQLTQAIGNALESIWWRVWGGFPTDWVRIGKGDLLAKPQIIAIEEQLLQKLELQGPISLKDISSTDWLSITRQMYVAISAYSRSGRIDMFNGNYGLNRGIAAAFLILALLTVIHNWIIALLLFIGSLIAIYRMYRYGRYYAREIFIEFLQLPIPKT